MMRKSGRLPVARELREKLQEQEQERFNLIHKERTLPPAEN